LSFTVYRPHLLIIYFLSVMKQTLGKPSNTLTFTMQPGVAELHSENREWLSEVDFMLDKVLFFEHLLLGFSKKICSPGTDLFTCNEIKYWQHTLASLKTAIVDHENHLTKIAKGYKDTGHPFDYIKQHGHLKKEVHSIQVSFLHFKDSLYTFITSML
jgi:hypothetical protein